MFIEMNGKIIAEKTFHLYARDEGQFWKQRGF